MPIKVVVDSTAYLTHEQLKAGDIQVMSLSVNFKEESLLETEVPYGYFYEKLRRSAELPTSSQPNVHQMNVIFEDILAQGNDLVVLTISSEMSGTYQTAHMLCEELKVQFPNRRIEIIDSRANCMQLGYQAVTAAELAMAGASMDEILIATHKVIKSTRFLFTLDTLEYLEKGGRIGKASALLGSLLNIKPILTVVDGKTDTMAKVRSHRKAIATIAEKVTKDVAAYGFKRACIHHIDNEEGIVLLKEALPKEMGIDFEVVSIGPVIGTHVGPGAIGIVYETKEPMV